MHIIRGYIKFSRSVFVLMGLLSFFGAITIKAMNISQIRQNKSRLLVLKKKEGARKEAVKKAIQERIGMLDETKNEYFIHAAGTAQGEVISKEALQRSGKLAVDLDYLEVFGGQAIPLKGYSPENIKILCDALKGERALVENDIKDFELKKLINVVNMFSYFGVEEEKKNDKNKEENDKLEDVVLRKIEKAIIDQLLYDDRSENIDNLKTLNSDLQKKLMVIPTCAYLKSLIIKAKFIKVQSLNKADAAIGDVGATNVIEISPDGKKIVTGGSNKLILWDISDLDHIVPYDLNKLFWNLIGNVEAVAFSQDSNKVVVYSSFGRLMLWDIRDLKKITFTELGNDVGSVLAMAFSPDGSKIATGGFDGNLKLWDINLKQHTSILPKKNIKTISTIVFTRNDNQIVIGGIDEFRLLDINDLSHVKSFPLGYLENFVTDVAMSSEGNKIIADDARHEGFGELMLYDIKDLNLDKNLPYLRIRDINKVASLGFSDDKEIFVINEEKNPGPIKLTFNDDIFTLLNISDPRNIIRTNVKIPGSYSLVRYNSNSNKIVLKPHDLRKDIFLITLLTEAQKSLINSIKDYKSDQMRLMYELCLYSFKDYKIKLDRLCELAKRVSDILPLPMQALLYEIGLFEDLPYNFCTLY